MGAGASTRPARQKSAGLYWQFRPQLGRCPLCGPVTPCAAAAVPQHRGHHAGPCAAALSGRAAVCCCVTPHTRPTALPPSDRCVAALEARHPSQCPPLRPCVAVGLRALWALLLAYNVARLKARLRAGSTARPKCEEEFRPPLGGAVMRRRAGQCWGLCSARCASHRPQQGRRCPFGRHARPPPGQAVQHAKRSVPPSPPLLSEWGQGGRWRSPAAVQQGKRCHTGRE